MLRAGNRPAREPPGPGTARPGNRPAREPGGTARPGRRPRLPRGQRHVVDHERGLQLAALDPGERQGHRAIPRRRSPGTSAARTRVLWLRFEKVATVLPPTATVSVSYAVVVLVSAVSTCSQKHSVALVQPAGSVTVWGSVSVCATP